MLKGDTPALNKIDKRQFENLCGLQCTKAEISAWFGISDDSLETWCKKTYNNTFSAIFSEKRKIGNISLRRAQRKLAENNATMSIWLGEQYLGQTDKLESSIDITAQPKLEIKVVDNSNLKEVMYEEEGK